MWQLHVSISAILFAFIGQNMSKLEIWDLSPRWDLNPGLSLVQRIASRTHYQSVKGELTQSQGLWLLNLRVTSSGSIVAVTCYEPSYTSLCLLANYPKLTLLHMHKAFKFPPETRPVPSACNLDFSMLWQLKLYCASLYSIPHLAISLP